MAAIKKQQQFGEADIHTASKVTPHTLLINYKGTK